MKQRETVILERRFVPEGAVIIKEGEPGTTAYLVQSGRVRVSINDTGRIVELAELSVGAIFGETALVFDELRSATVTALEDCNLIVINRKTLQDKLSKSDPTVRALVQMLSRRVLDSNNALLNKAGDLTSMIDTMKAVYENVLKSLPPNRRRTFQNTVLPKLEDFLTSVRAFEKKYEDDDY